MWYAIAGALLGSVAFVCWCVCVAAGDADDAFDVMFDRERRRIERESE